MPITPYPLSIFLLTPVPQDTPTVLSEEHQNMMLAYLSGLRRGARLRSLDDLAALTARDLLLLARKVDEAALGLFIQLLKSSGDGGALFAKLMGDHEEDNRPLVDEFFNRYYASVLALSDGAPPYNPLEVYLPAHALDDLAFVQSRQAFFLRQTCAVINEYLDKLFPRGGESHAFPAGGQDQAWTYFWNKVISR
jgi:hypothetical protein